MIPEIKTEEAGAAPAELPPPYNPFNLRNQVLSSLYRANVASSRTSQRAANAALAKARNGQLLKPAEALDAARRLVQDAINKELAGVIDRYVTRFLHPAIANIRANGHPVSPQLIDDLRVQILEEAKAMYRGSKGGIVASSPGGSSRLAASSAHTLNASSSSSLTPSRPVQSRPRSNNSAAAAQPAIVEERLPPSRKRGPPQLFSPSVVSSLNSANATDSDAESDTALPALGPRARKKPKYLESLERPLSRSSTPGGSRPWELKLEDLPRWNPVRVLPDTQFILGSKANKALGMGDQRGRIYNKHPRLFKYVSDAEDKDWLYKSGHKSSKGVGRAFLLFLDDVLHLADSDDYKKSAALEREELRGFAVPAFLQEKIKAAMAQEFERHRVKLET